MLFTTQEFIFIRDFFKKYSLFKSDLRKPQALSLHRINRDAFISRWRLWTHNKGYEMMRGKGENNLEEERISSIQGRNLILKLSPRRKSSGL